MLCDAAKAWSFTQMHDLLHNLVTMIEASSQTSQHEEMRVEEKTAALVARSRQCSRIPGSSLNSWGVVVGNAETSGHISNAFTRTMA